MLRSQAQAVYSADNFGHFGLNLRRYAHFTSPIRRYADLIVHRALVRALGFGNDGLTDAEIGELDEIAQAISDTERRAMAAERETADRLIAAHLADRIGASFAARVSGLVRSGLFVRLIETGADGFVPASSIGREYFYHDEVRPGARRRGVGSCLPARRSGRGAAGRGDPDRGRAEVRDAERRPQDRGRCETEARWAPAC